jgi:hypothetical protein
MCEMASGQRTKSGFEKGAVKQYIYVGKSVENTVRLDLIPFE